MPTSTSSPVERQDLRGVSRPSASVGLTSSTTRQSIHPVRTFPRSIVRLCFGYETLLPPLVEQRRIAAILDKADAIRRKREEGIRLTEELLRSTFLEMFGPGNLDYLVWTAYRIEELAAPSPVPCGRGPSVALFSTRSLWTKGLRFSGSTTRSGIDSLGVSGDSSPWTGTKN